MPPGTIHFPSHTEPLGEGIKDAQDVRLRLEATGVQCIRFGAPWATAPAEGVAFRVSTKSGRPTLLPKLSRSRTIAEHALQLGRMTCDDGLFSEAC